MSSSAFFIDAAAKTVMVLSWACAGTRPAVARPAIAVKAMRTARRFIWRSKAGGHACRAQSGKVLEKGDRPEAPFRATRPAYGSVSGRGLNLSAGRTLAKIAYSVAGETIMRIEPVLTPLS